MSWFHCPPVESSPLLDPEETIFILPVGIALLSLIQFLREIELEKAFEFENIGACYQRIFENPILEQR